MVPAFGKKKQRLSALMQLFIIEQSFFCGAGPFLGKRLNGRETLDKPSTPSSVSDRPVEITLARLGLAVIRL
jgi:hypothetical protein